MIKIFVGKSNPYFPYFCSSLHLQKRMGHASIKGKVRFASSYARNGPSKQGYLRQWMQQEKHMRPNTAVEIS